MRPRTWIVPLAFAAACAAGGAHAGDLDQLAGLPVVTDLPSARASLRVAQQAQRRDPARARELVRAAYQQGLPRPEADRALGEALVRLEELEAATFHLERYLAVHPDEDPQAYLHLGMAQGLAGDVQREIASYQRALELDPNSGEAHFYLSLAYDKIDDSPKVLHHAQRAIRIDPAYKQRLKPAIKDSNVSRKISRIVQGVLSDSRDRRLSDAKIEAYAAQIGHILGKDGAPRPPPTLRDAQRRKREALRQQLQALRLKVRRNRKAEAAAEAAAEAPDPPPRAEERGFLR